MFLLSEVPLYGPRYSEAAYCWTRRGPPNPAFFLDGLLTLDSVRFFLGA